MSDTSPVCSCRGLVERLSAEPSVMLVYSMRPGSEDYADQLAGEDRDYLGNRPMRPVKVEAFAPFTCYRCRWVHNILARVA